MTVKKKRKKAYQDGDKFFRSKQMLDYHLELKELKKEGLIKSFNIPTADELVKQKYRSVKVEVDGHIFDSMMESKFYLFLLNEKKNGRVKEIELQPKFTLQEGYRKYGKKIREIGYKADFTVTTEDGKKTVYDVKGFVTTDFKIKRKMFDYVFSELDLVLTKWSAKNKEWVYF